MRGMSDGSITLSKNTITTVSVTVAFASTIFVVADAYLGLRSDLRDLDTRMTGEIRRIEALLPRHTSLSTETLPSQASPEFEFAPLELNTALTAFQAPVEPLMCTYPESIPDVDLRNPLARPERRHDLPVLRGSP